MRVTEYASFVFPLQVQLRVSESCKKAKKLPQISEEFEAIYFLLHFLSRNWKGEKWDEGHHWRSKNVDISNIGRAEDGSRRGIATASLDVEDQLLAEVSMGHYEIKLTEVTQGEIDLYDESGESVARAGIKMS